MKILLVDDEPRNLRILEEILYDDEFTLTKAETGKEALDKLTTLMPDLILLDGMLPDIDGLDITKQIKSNESLRHIPVILVTGRASEAEKKAGLQAGANGYITKPFNEDELLEIINSL